MTSRYSINYGSIAKEHKSKHKTRLHPDAKLRGYWNICMLFACVYNAWSVPARLAFTSILYSYVIHWKCDIFFITDMVLNFKEFSFVLEGELMVDLNQLKTNYLSNRFKMDLVSTIPLDFIAFFPLRKSTNRVFILALCRLPKLFRMIRMQT